MEILVAAVAEFLLGVVIQAGKGTNAEGLVIDSTVLIQGGPAGAEAVAFLTEGTCQVEAAEEATAQVQKGAEQGVVAAVDVTAEAGVAAEATAGAGVTAAVTAEARAGAGVGAATGIAARGLVSANSTKWNLRGPLRDPQLTLHRKEVDSPDLIGRSRFLLHPVHNDSLVV